MGLTRSYADALPHVSLTGSSRKDATYPFSQTIVAMNIAHECSKLTPEGGEEPAYCADLKATYEGERMANPKGMAATSTGPKIARWADFKRVGDAPLSPPLARHRHLVACAQHS